MASELTEATAKLTNETDKTACELIEKQEFKPCWTKKFPVIGKGTLLFNIARNKPFYITVRGHDHSHYAESWIALTVTKDRVSFLNKIHDKDPALLCEDPPLLCTRGCTPSDFFANNVGLEPNFKCTYWLSYDRDNMVIKYGKGYRMKKTTILEYNFYQRVDNKEEKDERFLTRKSTDM